MFLSEMFRECIIYHPNWSISYNKIQTQKWPERSKQHANALCVKQQQKDQQKG